MLCFLIEARGSLVVKALSYKKEGRGFETWWGGILNLPNLSGRTRPWGLLRTRKLMFMGNKVRPVRGADLTAIYKPIV
jgi:hypothetical protein